MMMVVVDVVVEKSFWGNILRNVVVVSGPVLTKPGSNIFAVMFPSPSYKDFMRIQRNVTAQ